MSVGVYGKIKIVKMFASSELKSRNRAFLGVRAILQKRESGDKKDQLNSHDVLAIWKGLYVWLWIQDKPIMHEEVVGKICQLLQEIKSEEVNMEFIDAFFVTMMREWKKIDIHRLDKFYMLARDFFVASLNWLKTHESTSKFVELFTSKVLNGIIDQGVEFKLHIIDILIDELMRSESSQVLVTNLIKGSILSISKLSQKHPYVLRMKKRVIERLIPLFVTGKLQVDLNAIGTDLRKAAVEEDVTGRVRKMFYGLSKGFINSKLNSNTTGDENMTVDQETDKEPINENEGSEMEVDEPAVEKDAEITTPEMKETADDDIEKTITGDSAMDNDTDEMDSEEDEVVQVKEVEVKDPSIPVKAALKKSKVARKPRIMKEMSFSMTEESPITRNRRVTFGKKYTKKFKKGEIDVALSQGTVKNEKVKSILKRGSI